MAFVKVFCFSLPQRFFLKGQLWTWNKGFSYSDTCSNIYCSRIPISPTSGQYEKFMFPSTPNCQMPCLRNYLFLEMLDCLFSLCYSAQLFHLYWNTECPVFPLDLVNQNHLLGLPWWRSGWESACQCRGHGFEPWSGKIPHAAEQLSLCATTTEPARLEPVLHSKRDRDGERPAHCDEEWPPLAATRESPRTETKTQHSQ